MTGTELICEATCSHIMKSHQTAILVVEDNCLIRGLAMEILLGHGLTTYEADSADEALFMIAAYRDIAILFTDIEMPGGMDGIELAYRIHRARSDIGIIVTSGRNYGIRPKSLPDYGAFLGKPYRPQELLDAVDRRIAQNRQEPALQ